MSTGESVNEDQSKRPYKPVVSDFKLYHILGEGAYAKVYFGLFKKNAQFYAIKVVDKDHVQRFNKFDAVINERNVLNTLKGHPGIVSLYYTLQDPYSLYYVLEFCQGGELYDQLKSDTLLPVETVRFYAAEIAEIIHYMHKMNIIHRDIKPSNILLTDRGHIKLCDFGTAKILKGDEPAIPLALTTPTGFASEGAPGRSQTSHLNNDYDHSVDEEMYALDLDDAVNQRREVKKAQSFVGTADYVYPEMLNGNYLTFGCDWWSFGILLYEMLVGRVPFKGPSEYLTFQSILNDELTFPPDIEPAAKDLISALLHKDVNLRLGTKYEHERAIFQHPYFESVWQMCREYGHSRGNGDTSPLVRSNSMITNNTTQSASPDSNGIALELGKIATTVTPASTAATEVATAIPSPVAGTRDRDGHDAQSESQLSGANLPLLSASSSHVRPTPRNRPASVFTLPSPPPHVSIQEHSAEIKAIVEEYHRQQQQQQQHQQQQQPSTITTTTTTTTTAPSKSISNEAPLSTTLLSNQSHPAGTSTTMGGTSGGPTGHHAPASPSTSTIAAPAHGGYETPRSTMATTSTPTANAGGPSAADSDGGLSPRSSTRDNLRTSGRGRVLSRCSSNIQHSPIPKLQEDNAFSSAEYLQHLQPSESIIAVGLVTKNSRWSRSFFLKKRFFLLTSGARLLYLTENKMTVKGEIDIRNGYSIRIIDSKNMEITVAKRVYRIACQQSPSISASFLLPDRYAPAEEKFLYSVDPMVSQHWKYAIDRVVNEATLAEGMSAISS